MAKEEVETEESKGLSPEIKRYIAIGIAILIAIPLAIGGYHLFSFLAGTIKEAVAGNKVVKLEDLSPSDRGQSFVGTITFITDPVIPPQSDGGNQVQTNIYHYRITTDVILTYRKNCSACVLLERKLNSGKPRIIALLKRALSRTPYTQLNNLKSRQVVEEKLVSLVNDYLLLEFDENGNRVKGFVKEGILAVTLDNFDPVRREILLQS